MPNYQDTVIYKISCAGQDYVGHTTNYKRRCIQHKSDCTCETSQKYNSPLYKHIRANGGVESCEFLILEKYPCNTGEEARLREQHWYREVNAALNVVTPGQTQVDYREINRDILLIKKHNYYNKNRKKILLEQKEYRSTNVEHRKQYQYVYKEKNREAINMKQNQKYYQNHDKNKADRRAAYHANKKLKVSSLPQKEQQLVSSPNP
jgi:hypothetical protein